MSYEFVHGTVVSGFLRPTLGPAGMPALPGTALALDIWTDFQRLARMTISVPQEFSGVTAVAKANIYFEGKVISHTLLIPDGSKKTIGLIYPGKFHFGTGQGERMEIVAGECEVVLDGQSVRQKYGAGQRFEVSANSGFEVEVSQGICEYICSFLVV